MVLIKKFLIFNLFFVLLSVLSAAETIFIPQGSFLFRQEKDKDKWETAAKTQQDFSCEVIRKEKVLLALETTIRIHADAYRLNIPGQELYYFPAVHLKKKTDGSFAIIPDKIDLMMFLGAFFFVIGLAAAAGHFRLKSEKKKYLLPAALLFFFWAYAFWYIGFISNAFILPTDENYYYNISRKLLAWDFSSMPYRYTIGYPILILPFIFHARTLLDFFLPYMNFQTFILIPGLLLVFYRFFRAKMGLSRMQSFCALLLWLVLMIFYSPMYDISNPSAEYIPENYSSNANFFPPSHNYHFAFFQMTWLGRNAMSDYAAVFLFVVLLCFAMKKSRSLLRFSILSMGFGFLCLVRINYIFFAPLLAFVFYDSFSELWKNRRNYLYAALCGTAGFMLVFVWQFILNKIQFGSPFIWPYSLHEYAPDRGFVWNVVPYGFKFLFRTNYVYLVPGIASLFFIPERKTRALLALWIFPTLIFYSGYPIIFNNPVRFIFALYPPLLAALVMNPVWKTAWTIRIKAALVLFCACVLCKSNIFYPSFQPWDLGHFGVSNTAFMVIQGAVFLFCCAVIFSMRKELKTDPADTVSSFRFLILFTVVFFSGTVCPYIAGVLALAAFAYGLYDTWLVIREIMTGKNSPAEDSKTGL
ncbi:MAG: hypothetical protein IJS14_11825 [Lentisphaeria bacterium]|nr:hypothetical protein [Lentisphaeria bacterium]